VYGMARPLIGSTILRLLGPLNTYGPNFLPEINGIILEDPGLLVVTTDDIYRRILTWHFFKGDGKYFNARWLKRRIWRFLFGENGWSPLWVGDATIGDTRQISISLGVHRNVTIRFVLGKRTVVGGAMSNTFGCNGFGPLTN